MKNYKDISQYRRQTGKSASGGRSARYREFIFGKIRTFEPQPASALGKRDLKSSSPTHSGVIVIRTIDEIIPRNWVSHP